MAHPTTHDNPSTMIVAWIWAGVAVLLRELHATGDLAMIKDVLTIMAVVLSITISLKNVFRKESK